MRKVDPARRPVVGRYTAAWTGNPEQPSGGPAVWNDALFPLPHSCGPVEGKRTPRSSKQRWTRLAGARVVPHVCGALPLALGMAGLAHAEGSLQVRFYSVPPPLEWLDSVSVSGHYQTSPGPSSTVLDLSAERSLMNFGVRYNRPHHAFQAAGRRSADVAAGRTDTSATVVYTFVPQAPPEGLTVTSATVLYTLSSSQTPTYGYQSHTAGVGVGVRLSRELNLTTNATATVV